MRIPADFCSLLSAQDITEVVGQPMPAPEPSASGSGERDCQSNAPGSGVGVIQFSIFVNRNSCFLGEKPSSRCLADTASTFAADKSYDAAHHGPLSEISGLGEQAYCATVSVVGTTNADLAVLAGWFRLGVDTDSCAHSQALARLLLAKL